MCTHNWGPGNCAEVSFERFLLITVVGIVGIVGSQGRIHSIHHEVTKSSSGPRIAIHQKLQLLTGPLARNLLCSILSFGHFRGQTPLVCQKGRVENCRFLGPPKRTRDQPPSRLISLSDKRHSSRAGQRVTCSDSS
ncbi:hypothetical protein M440DRAFT_1161108 [Trichoderma longibrachiatum ATCC 18648]|uniref:Uncharacterized protein n=1 Tax=Trichoderma longibrachiatum ATCC 18648 TaxID=983965 RepID=A0A2T4CC52_TRILO|nr:hypothetical protein M440DRAFT_1161108 [Trichoderma longibrachiatum ATCC 18648]